MGLFGSGGLNLGSLFGGSQQSGGQQGYGQTPYKSIYGDGSQYVGGGGWGDPYGPGAHSAGGGPPRRRGMGGGGTTPMRGGMGNMGGGPGSNWQPGGTPREGIGVNAGGGGGGLADLKWGWSSGGPYEPRGGWGGGPTEGGGGVEPVYYPTDPEAPRNIRQGQPTKVAPIR